MTEKRIVVTARSFGSGDRDLARDLEDAGFTVVRATSSHDKDELAAALAGAVAWIAGIGPVTSEHFDLAPDLRVLARYGVGVDAVDLAAASQRGIVVTNTPGSNSDAVADHAIALLAVLRRVPRGDRAVRVGDWTVQRGRELGASTVGIVGFGRIGQGVARRLQGFGSTVRVHDPYVDRLGAAAVADALAVLDGHPPAHRVP